MEIGTLVDGRYRLEQAVGQGGMGVVFRARDVTSNKSVAIKVIRATSALEVERARRETRALTTLIHPTIVTHVADGVTETGLPYLVMEWLDGVTVETRLEGRGFTLRESCAMVLRVAQALATAHAAGILHRDVKPANVLMQNDDPASAKLIDFGVARFVENESGLTRTGIAIGTPGYMSPEQARGVRQLTPASDVFGLGCLFYECLAGKPAFSGESIAATMFKIVVVDPTPLDFVCPTIPRRLRKLVERMLVKRAASRISSCAEVAAELEILALHDETIAPKPIDDRFDTASPEPSQQLEPSPGPASPTTVVHCCVLATRELPDGAVDKPAEQEYERVLAIVEPLSANLEVLGNGALLAHVQGEPADATHRAGGVALAMKQALPGWSFVISSVRADLGVALDEGTTMLTRSVTRAIFKTPPGTVAAGAITVHATAARYLGETFELEMGNPPTLIGPRTR